MTGMGQIVTWSVRDETLHCVSIIRLYKTFLGENPNIDRKSLARDLTEACQTIIGLEDAFIDLAFEEGPVEGLTATEIKTYIRYIADLRLVQLGLRSPLLYRKKSSPLDGWNSKRC